MKQSYILIVSVIKIDFSKAENSLSAPKNSCWKLNVVYFDDASVVVLIFSNIDIIKPFTKYFPDGVRESFMSTLTAVRRFSRHLKLFNIR